ASALARYKRAGQVPMMEQPFAPIAAITLENVGDVVWLTRFAAAGSRGTCATSPTRRPGDSGSAGRLVSRSRFASRPSVRAQRYRWGAPSAAGGLGDARHRCRAALPEVTSLAPHLEAGRITRSERTSCLTDGLPTDRRPRRRRGAMTLRRGT